jgi:hypothetical protein
MIQLMLIVLCTLLAFFAAPSISQEATGTWWNKP